MKANQARYGITAAFGSIAGSAVMIAEPNWFFAGWIAIVVGFCCAMVVPYGETP